MMQWRTVATQRGRRRGERRELRAGGFTRAFTSRLEGVALVMITVITVAVFVLVGVTTDLFAGESQANAMSAGIAAIVGAGALATGLQQWRAARNETTLDKFYERLEASNTLLDAWPEARGFVALVPPGDDPLEREGYYRRVMYVYRELDDLEYGLAKYRIGFMSSENAYRCLRTFRARCLSEEFRTLARECVRCEPGYNEETERVVAKAAEWARAHGPREVVDDPAERHRATRPPHRWRSPRRRRGARGGARTPA
jgi:hypothetical protein